MPNENQPASPVNKMSLDELRIKVAELCPDLFEIRETYRDGRLVKYVIRKGDEDLTEIDPTRDLNAIHEVTENCLFSDGSWKRFVNHLENITNAIEQPEPTRTMLLIHATAAQRCRALVTTMEDKT